MPERNPTGNHIMISNNNWWCKPKGKVWLGSTGPGNGMRKWVRTKMMPRVNQVPTQKHTSPEKRNPKFLVMVPPVLIFQGFQDLSPLIFGGTGGCGWLAHWLSALSTLESVWRASQFDTLLNSSRHDTQETLGSPLVISTSVRLKIGFFYHPWQWRLMQLNEEISLHGWQTHNKKTTAMI